MTAVMGPAMSSLSVVSVGVVQCSVTASPTRVAVSAVEATTWGSLSDGGSGGPGLAHPARPAKMASRASSIPVRAGRPCSRAAAGRMWCQICIQTEAIAFLDLA
jgi:hypothetical protein